MLRCFSNIAESIGENFCCNQGAEVKVQAQRAQSWSLSVGEIIHVNTRNYHQILKLRYQRRQTIDSEETIARQQTSATSTEIRGNQLDLSLLCVCICLNKNQHFFPGILEEIEH